MGREGGSERRQRARIGDGSVVRGGALLGNAPPENIG